jgi:hypothetical protein
MLNRVQSPAMSRRTSSSRSVYLAMPLVCSAKTCRTLSFCASQMHKITPGSRGPSELQQLGKLNCGEIHRCPIDVHNCKHVVGLFSPPESPAKVDSGDLTAQDPGPGRNANSYRPSKNCMIPASKLRWARADIRDKSLGQL